MKYLGRQYKQIGHYLFKDMKWFLYGTLAAFLGICVVSTIVLEQNPDMVYSILQSFEEATEDIAQDGEIIWYMLFLNNLKACLIGIAVGFIPFLFVSAFFVITNAAIIGAACAVYGMSGISIFMMVICGLLPHGIFEFPALIIAFAMGLYICYCLVVRICEGKYNKGKVAYAAKNTLRVILGIEIPFLFFAALIESYITPVILNSYLN